MAIDDITFRRAGDGTCVGFVRHSDVPLRGRTRPEAVYTLRQPPARRSPPGQQIATICSGVNVLARIVPPHFLGWVAAEHYLGNAVLLAQESYGHVFHTAPSASRSMKRGSSTPSVNTPSSTNAWPCTSSWRPEPKPLDTVTAPGLPSDNPARRARRR